MAGMHPNQCYRMVFSGEGGVNRVCLLFVLRLDADQGQKNHQRLPNISIDDINTLIQLLCPVPSLFAYRLFSLLKVLFCFTVSTMYRAKGLLIA